MKFPTAAVTLALATTLVAGSAGLPPRVVDSHHHFFDYTPFGSNWTYLPEAYEIDVTEPLASNGVELAGTVHCEGPMGFAVGGVNETRFIDALRAPHVKAIIAYCDLSDPTGVATCLEETNAASSLVRGIRKMVDGDYGQNDGVDYLRDGENGGVVPSFEEGYAALADYGWSFDAFVWPEQLEAMAGLAERHPNVPVIIDHIGKLKLSAPPVTTEEGEEQPAAAEWTLTPEDNAAIEVWRTGMQLMADLPHTYVKLSMLGYGVPDWITNEYRIEVIESLVLELVEMFGPRRCMFALNWWQDAPTSDSDNRGTISPDPVQLTNIMSEWLKDYSDGDRDWIFAKTAETVYRFNEEAEGGGGGDDKVMDDSSGSIHLYSSSAVMMLSAGVAAAWMAI